MAEPQERHYNIERLNMIFALASCVLLLALVWMVADDYSREWKNYQRDFRALEIEKTRVKYDYAENELKAKEEYRSLGDHLKEARKAFDANCRSALSAGAQKKLAVEDDLLNQKYKFAKAEYDAARYRYETAKANGGAGVGQAQKELDETGLKLASLKSALDRSSQQLADQKKTADACGARLKDLERQERAFLQKINIFKRKLAKIDPNEMNFTNRIADMVRDLPILDLANPNFKLQQIVLKDIPEDLNFAKVPTVDRCVTCHLGISNPDYKDAPQPFTTHPNLGLYLGNNSAHPLDDFGCTVCHGGRGRGTDFASAVHTPSSARQAREWEKKYHWRPLHHWEKPMLPMTHVEAGCFQCHAGQTVIKGAEKLNLGLNLIEKAGCYACHEIDRYKNWPKPGPDLTKLGSKISKSWAYRWIEDPHAFRSNTWMPAFFNQSNTNDPQSVKRGEQEIHAIVAYLFQNSGKPAAILEENSGDFAQAEIPSAGDPQKGKELVASIGCLGCHRIEPLSQDQPATRDILRREHGPNLVGLGSKTSNKWVYNWLKNPHAYNPDTKMPSLRLSDQEAADIGAYLVSLRADVYDKTTIPPVDETVLNEITVDFLKKTETEGAARAKLATMSLDEKLSYCGLRLIRQYGCFSCHNIAGFEKEKPIGTALTEEGSRPVERLDFGFVPIDHTREAWFFQKLKDPRVFDGGKVKPEDEKLRMPNFHFSDEEAEAVTTALLSFVKEVPEAKIVARTPRNLAIERGQQLVRTLNCQGCHIVEKEGGAIQPSVKEWLVNYNNTSENEAGAVVPSFSPPDLIGEGKKVQSAWLFHFIHEPTTVRPWLKARMPTYALDNGELNDLVQYFVALDGEDALFEENIQGALPEEEHQAAEKLFGKDYFDCAKCHIIGSQLPGGSPENWAPDFALAKSRLRPEWILKWLTNPQDLLPGTRMPTYFDPAGFDAAGPEDILGGDERKQIRALRDYLLTLTQQPGDQPAQPSADHP
ncbi:MAG: c-type cytochrome [Candidatus Omnitrophica bacterium]|nr:c-type cytochrome [Candidatus Omnitrophota bacterium]